MLKITRNTFDEVMIPCYKPFNCLIVKGKGSYLFDSNGNKYVDFTGGIAVNSLGHCNKGVQKVIKKQIKKLIHASNIFTNISTLTLAVKLTKHTDFSKVFFVNSGAEANEAALKLARRVAFNLYGENKNEIISFGHSFHGRTLFSVSVGGQDKYSDGFGPKPGAITHLPFNDIETFKQHISDKTCAVILEPIQGEGGIIEANPDFLKTVRDLCTSHNALLILDEVQTGVGRCGTFYAYQDTNIIPDILTSAKGLAAGIPIGSVMTSDEIAKHFSPGTHGSTFGGNPLACAVGTYVVNTISDKAFLNNVKAKGIILKHSLEELKDKYGIFKEIRGKGLLLGAVLNEDLQDKAGEIQQICAKYGLFILTAGHGVLRFAPALNIKNKTIKEGVNLLDKALADFTKV